MALFSNLRIFTKLLIVPLIVMFALVSVAVLASLSLRSEKNALEEIHELRLTNYALAASSATDMYGVQANAYKILGWYSANVPESRIQAVYKEQQELCGKVNQILLKLAKDSGLESDEGKHAAKAASIVQKYTKNFGELMDLAAADVPTATMFMATMETAYEELRVELNKLLELEKKYADSTAFSAAKRAGTTILIVSIFTVAVLAVAILITFLIGRAISHSIGEVKAAAEAMADGNLGVDLKIKSKDEIGQLAAAMEKMIETLRQVIGKMKAGVDELKNDAQVLSGLSANVSSATITAANTSTAVAASTEESSVMVNNIATAVETSSANVNAIATAIEEMSSTIHEIANSAAGAREMADGAAKDADLVAGGVKVLSTASVEIGRVTDAITDISEQTKLLALNATIEAARAGEAGKGFAVVASEIKELARQTMAATTEIGQKVEKIQSSTRNTVDGISNIVNSIRRMKEAMTSIAAAIEQQSVTTREIAKNVAETSGGIKQVSGSAGQMSSVTEDIAKEIMHVSEIMEQLSRAVQGLEESSGSLATLAGDMEGMSGWFKV